MSTSAAIVRANSKNFRASTVNQFKSVPIVNTLPIGYQPRQTLTSKEAVSTVLTTVKGLNAALSTLNTEDAIRLLEDVVQQHLDAMGKRVNELLYGNWVLWVGEDGTEYFNWKDLPDKELLRARLTGKYQIGE